MWAKLVCFCLISETDQSCMESNKTASNPDWLHGLHSKILAKYFARPCFAMNQKCCPWQCTQLSARRSEGQWPIPSHHDRTNGQMVRDSQGEKAAKKESEAKKKNRIKWINNMRLNHGENSWRRESRLYYSECGDHYST